MSFWGELKRRNVFKVGAAYLIAAWLILQVASIIFPALSFPGWALPLVTVFLIIGFIVAIILAWAYEVTPEGVKLTKKVPLADSITHVTGRKLNYILAGVIVLAVAYILFDNLYLDRRVVEPEVASTAVEQTPTNEEVEEVPKTIAVLPFSDLSPEKDQEYFVDGLSEELLNCLAKIKGLKVTSRTSSFAFKDTDKTLQEVAGVLGVEHILEGSVRKVGNALRITAQLIYVKDDSHLWSETYDRELKDIFDLQEDIATSVADKLKITLGVGGSLKQAGGTDNEEAYELYLEAKGQLYSLIRSSSQVNETIDAALALDPKFALAWVLKASYSSSIEEGLNAIQKAIELDPELVEAYSVLGLLRTEEGDWIGAEQAFSRALELNTEPLPDFGLNFAVFYSTVGYIEKANEFLKEMKKRDPLNIPVRIFLMFSYASLGDSQRTREEFEHGRKLFGDVFDYGMLCILGIDARVSSAKKSINPTIISDAVVEFQNSPEMGVEELHQIYSEDNNPGQFDYGSISTWAAYFGDFDFAFEAMKKGSILFAWFPVMHEVRQLPRFKEFIRETGLIGYWNEFGWPDICRPLDDRDFECD